MYVILCGEEIVIPVDLTAGEEQEYVEDCPFVAVPMLSMSK